MLALRQYSALFVVILLAPNLWAQDKPASLWAVDRSLTVSPQGAPALALDYRLLPLSSLLKEGNAVPIYSRLVHEQSDASRKYWTETPKAWNLLSIDKIPLADARKFLQQEHNLLRQLDLGARRRTAEWNYTLDQGNPIEILMPDTQSMRNYAPMQILQIRVALAEGDFPRAAHHLQTGFAMSRHVNEGPFLIGSLVALILASQFTGCVADFIERPDAPNLYWALATLPHPLIDLRQVLDHEFRMVEGVVPELEDLDRERTPEQWDAILRRIRTQLYGLPQEGKPPKLPDWYPKDSAPEDSATKSHDLPAARAFVARTKGLTADKVEAMPASQVLLLYMADTYRKDRDAWYRVAYLPYPQARPFLEAAQKQFLALRSSEAHLLSQLFPAFERILYRQIAVERNLAALRVIEALRIYAAAHDGKLPDKLADVTEVPVPDDPGTGQHFKYQREGDTATLISQVPGDPIPNQGLRYRVTIRKP
jgi:hypothetical protein